MANSMNPQALRERTAAFAHRCVKAALALPGNCLGEHIGRQLIRCATSVASNYRATCLAQSKADFGAKLSAVVEEADECIFWIEFARDENLFEEGAIADAAQEARELAAVFVASRKTTRDRSTEFQVHSNAEQ